MRILLIRHKIGVLLFEKHLTKWDIPWLNQIPIVKHRVFLIIYYWLIKHLPSVLLVKHIGYSLVEQLVVCFFVINLGDYELTMVFSPQPNHWV